MNLKQLRYFFEIANEKQITKAAKKLHIAQPPLSQALKALETELGVLLFDRQGRTMDLTDAGIVLYEHAKEIFHKIDETITEVKETGEGIRGTLSIGCNKSCFSHIPDKISELHEVHPNVNFKLTEGDSYMLANQLTNNEIDLAIVRLPIEMKEFEYMKLPDEQYVVVAPNKYVTDLDRDYITIEELANIPLLLLHRLRGIGQYELIMNQFQRLGLTPNIICESPNVDMLLGLVSESLGAAIVPRSTLLKHNTRNASVLEIENTKIISESVIIWMKDRYLSVNAKRFINLFQ